MGNFSIKSSLFLAILSLSLFQSNNARDFASFGSLVTKESRRTIVSTECGAISAVDVHDGYNEGTYHLEFITLDASSLFLPVILHRDMVFYVHTGRGTVNWISEDSSKNRVEVQRGDIYRLEEGAIFYVQSHPDPNREKLRIHAIFNTILDEKPSETCVGVYSNVSDLIRGFDDEILKMAFGVSDEVIQGIKQVEKPPPIVQFERKNETDEVDWREGIIEAFIRGGRPFGSLNGKKKKKEKSTKPFNVFNTKPDVENCNGWSTAVTSKKFRPLMDSDIGMFIVNLTKGSMMGPHWNPKATEIAMVIHGQGMVQIICPSNPSGMEKKAFNCQNITIKVNQGDIFLVPRYCAMVQISFNNDSFVFVGFSTTANENHPQYLAGKRSALRTIDEEILAISFSTSNKTVARFLGSQIESIMFECASCAEELEKKMEAEKQRKVEEAKKKEEEEARKREEEEVRRREEEEEARKREEEERKKEEEEEARRREEEEEEEARKREEEEARKREEEEAREKKEEEEARKREEEEARRREEEEEARKKEEEERKKEEKKRKEEEARKREEEEEESRKREEEEARKREEEEARKKKEEEEARKREEEETRRREEEEARKREEEEARKREEEEARKKKEEEARKKEEKEEARKREEEEEEERKMEERKREEEEEVRKKEKEEAMREEEREKEEEATRQAEEEEEKARREEEKETRREEEEEAREEEKEAKKGKQIPEEEEKQDGMESTFI